MDGIFRQITSFPFEVIVGDDLSDDNTLNIIQSYSSTSMIKLIVLDRKDDSSYLLNRKKLGRLYNFTDIIMNCEGKYIALLDGDDYWTDHFKLQKQVEFLENNPEYVLVHHDAKTINENNEILNDSNLPFANKMDLSTDDLKEGKIISALTLCFRNVIREFPEEFYKVPIADMFLVSLLGHYGKAKYLPDIKPAMYREHSGGVWSSLNLQKRTRAKIKTWYIMSQYYKRIGNNELYKFYLRKASASSPTLIKLSLLNKDYRETLEASTNFLFKMKLDELRNFVVN